MEFTRYRDEYNNCTFCDKFPNCYYKQLQRMTAECEKWKSYYQLYRQNTDVIKKVHEVINSDLDYGIKFIEGGYIEKCEPLSSQELDKQVAYIINDIKNKLQIATEALRSILDEADVLNEFISKEGYLCGFVNIAQKALEQLGSEE